MLGRLASISIALGACVPDAPEGAHHESAIFDGVADSDPELYPGVVAIEAHLGWYAGSCSGTLVASDGTTSWVLTAAHCILSAYDPRPRLEILVGTGVVPSAWYPVQSAVLHPEWGPESFVVSVAEQPWVSNVPDLALLEVRGLPAAVTAAVIPLLSPDEGIPDVGSAVTLVGYGDTETLAPPNAPRTRGDVTIDSIFVGDRGYSHYFMNAGGDLPGACWGDSGGPAVFTLGDGSSRVAGVFSSLALFDPCETASQYEPTQGLGAAFLASAIEDEPIEPESCFACGYAAALPWSPAHPERGACVDEAAALTSPLLDEFGDCIRSGPWRACAEGPYGAAADVIQTFWDCVDDRACPGTCRPRDFATYRCGYALDGDACDDCMASAPDCCDAVSRCSWSDTCSPCLLQLEPSANLQCRADPTFEEVLACSEKSCGRECATFFGYDPPPEPDAGTPDAGDERDDAGAPDAGGPLEAPPRDDEGCGCRTTAGSPLGALVLAVAAGAIRRRRRGGASG